MQCPTDQTTLVMAERSGIEIDYCPTCRGVWLDRGELDKIIERAGPHDGAGPARRRVLRAGARRPPAAQEQRHAQPQQYRRKKKESWLGEIFDF